MKAKDKLWAGIVIHNVVRADSYKVIKSLNYEG